MTKETSSPLGVHYLAEFHKCDRSALDNTELISEMMLEAVKISGATLIQPFFHKFSPQGVSGIVVVAESHFAIHTWPEHNYAAVDLFSCGEFGYDIALMHIRHQIKSQEYSVTKIERGLINPLDKVISPVRTEQIRLQQEQ